MTHLAPLVSVLLLAGSPASPDVPLDARSAGISPLELVNLEAGDARLAATRAEYARRREAASPNARDQVRLADWCEAKGLKAEALAHLTVASRQAPDDASLHERLGERRHRGTWKTEAQVVAESAESRAQSEADDRWAPRLEAWHDALSDPARRPGAVRAMDEVRDPRAVPAIRWSFGDAQGWEQAWAVRLLGRIDAPRSTRELAKLAIFGLERPVRASALDRLVGRDPRSFVGLLINWLREPIRFQAQGPDDDGQQAVLRVEGDRAIVERAYEPFLVDRSGRRLPGDDRAGPFRTGLAAPTPQASADTRRAVLEREESDVRNLQRVNATIERTNARVEQALVRATGEDLGRSQQAWTVWWTSELGYGYESQSQSPKPYVSESVPISITAPVPVVREPPVPVPVQVHHSCFAAGTSVLSRTGPRAIETLRVGDQVLSRDPASGSVEFRPILAVFHNKPTRTMRVEVGAETILATPIHRFWVAGRGWAMARDLKVGDPVRALGGTAPVASVATDEVRPVYNLEVADGHSFFVGEGHYLVHDNSLVAPTDRAFDRLGAGKAGLSVRPGR